MSLTYSSGKKEIRREGGKEGWREGKKEERREGRRVCMREKVNFSENSQRYSKARGSLM